MGDNLDLAVVEVGDGDGVAEVSSATVDLDAGLQEGSEGGRVEDLVVGGLRSVDGELVQTDMLVALAGKNGLMGYCGIHTFLVTFWLFLFELPLFFA